MGFLAAFLVAGCSDDIAPEITSLDVSRLFSPVEFQALVFNKTSVRLNWKEVHNAATYDVEFVENGNEDFTGTPVKTISDITYDQLPLIVTGLGGETNYSVRVKASGKEISDSKWISTTFKTDPEQIFKEVDPEGMTHSSVILEWPAGEVATSILLTPGSITYQITAADIAAGKVTLTGLSSETTYTASLMNGTKVRGKVTFTTLIDLGGSTPVYDGDDLAAKLDNGADGESFVLFPGTYTVTNYAIKKNVTIRGLYPHNKPVVIGQFTFGTDLTSVIFSNINLNGQDASTYSNPLQFSATAHIGLISFDNCMINNYKSHLFYDSSKGTTLDEFKLTNCIVDNIKGDGGDGFDFRTSLVKKLTFSNTTFSNGFRTFIRLDYTGNIPQVITIDHCTFYRVCSFNNSNNVGLLRVSGTGAAHMISFTNSVLYGIGGDTAYGFMSKGKISSTTSVTLNGNNYFASPTLWTNDPFKGAATDFDSKATMLDPAFVDAAIGNFTITEPSLLNAKVGDPRWIK